MDLENYAAILEAQQANRDYSEAFWVWVNAGKVYGSPEDYTVWSMAGYTYAAHLAAML